MVFKKMSAYWTLMVAAFLGAGIACAQSSNSDVTIKLRDGSVIVGQVLGKDGSHYRVITTSMGIVNVRDADIVAMDDKNAPDWEKYQKAITNDPQSMQAIQNLSESREVMEMMADPKVKDAIARQDVEYLQNNAKFLKFMENPSVKTIIRNTQDTVESK
ncbi:MAG: hypothetical protein WC732_07230 [Candidatus Omnitrophota bacterium]